MTTSKVEGRHKRDAALTDMLHERAREEQLSETQRRNRGVSVSAARDALFLQRLEEASSRIFKNRIVPSKYAVRKRNDRCERILNVVLSDLHFHSLLDPREVPVRYGPVEEARRLAAVAVQAAEYKRQYRRYTTLYVHILGDIIQNQLHDLRDGAPLAEQSAAAMYLISQVLSFFSQTFPKVVVRCVPGNHGRNTARHHGRAIHQKWDSIETIIYYGVKMAARDLPNVTVEVSYRPYYIADAFDKRGFYTHGDSVINPGNPGEAIRVGSIEKQINRLNAGETHRGEKPADLFVVGHVHVGSQTQLGNGSIFMSNGCLTPPDPFAVAIGITESNCGQQLYESVKGHIVGDSRFVTVDEYTDKDRTLDKVIAPFKGF